jgi:hypothetical protein
VVPRFGEGGECECVMGVCCECELVVGVREEREMGEGEQRKVPVPNYGNHLIAQGKGGGYKNHFGLQAFLLFLWCFFALLFFGFSLLF